MPNYASLKVERCYWLICAGQIWSGLRRLSRECVHQLITTNITNVRMIPRANVSLGCGFNKYCEVIILNTSAVKVTQLNLIRRGTELKLKRASCNT